MIQNNVSCKIMNDAILRSGLSAKDCTIDSCESCRVFDNQDCTMRGNRLCTINNNSNCFIALHEHAVIKAQKGVISVNTNEWFCEKIQKKVANRESK